ncbi:hypothetical protein [Fluviicola taffensis]|uniref:Outer membrane protein beta-barrel domain-containing protein n=1 Tax=Fluviicola taffensis (strain DSM 16823 / NCIMB 13979 / RW262) TaxID=755732 RepID=F2ICR9_FLUTR|nr:hypothetical protein [Fluviicola taffensis]AEA42296.1 hypothetical protein Fluta_0287 [Fluviicola taffensis DSM 16823]
MKFTLFTILLLISSTTFSQEKAIKAFGDIQFGGATTLRGHGILNSTVGFNFALKNGLYFRAGGEIGFFGRRYDAYVKSSYTGYNLRIGFASSTSEKITIVPYVGIGMENSIVTTYELDALANAVSGITGDAVSSVTGKDAKAKRNKYLTEKHSYITVPVGVDIHIHAKSVGLVLGYYMNVSKYVEGGLRLGISFGKL